MLQPNPCKRLRISEIKNHPWLRKKLPIYAKLPYFTDHLTEKEFELDEDVLDQVRELNMESLNQMSDIDRIKKIIKRKMDDSFVTVYELIKN
jgi:hypothetical protein